ncbi:Putative uric acid sigma-54-dependent transcriptional regulator UacR [Frankliniella fusca]|uniref:Uric acid sigma-54-dependent transcriptional regulator UacR n=1 Tax=Frankliniella fusca TaxID=407009 RepID=A0AAE1I3T6_9NEOP|nr:Putative uric acid sigma-54-dependent transcriptional regulator UacR [Frankliniella fusca]
MAEWSVVSCGQGLRLWRALYVAMLEEKDKPFKPTAEMKSLASNTVAAILQPLDKRMIGLTFAILDTRIADAEGEDKARLVCLREETLCAFARHGIFGGKGYPVDHISKKFPKLSSLDDLIKNSKVSIGEILNQSDITQDATRVEELATSRKYNTQLERELVAQQMHLELSRMGKISEDLKQPNKGVAKDEQHVAEDKEERVLTQADFEAFCAENQHLLIGDSGAASESCPPTPILTQVMAHTIVSEAHV